MKETVAGNLLFYRKGLGLSQERLAEIAGVTRESIDNYELAKTLPDSKTLSALARALGVTLDDLLCQNRQGLPNFRFRAPASFAKKPQFAGQVVRMLETYNALEEAVGLPAYASESTPCYQVEGNEKRIQEIAAQFRYRLGFSEAPIPNLFEAVEAIGLKVLRKSYPIKGFFGLSACSDSHGAFVLVNRHNITIERQLFTLGHEIGHLIFHRDDYKDTLTENITKDEQKARQDVANFFASYLLLSQDALERALNAGADLLHLKAYFRVSYTVLLDRLDMMGKINYSDFIDKIRWQYRQHNGEELASDAEIEPRLLESNFPVDRSFRQLVWRALDSSKISETKAAQLLDMTVEELRKRRREARVYAIS